MTPVYLYALAAQRHARRRGQSAAATYVRQSADPSKPMIASAILAAVIVAVLTIGCEREVAPRAGGSPSSVPSAAPVPHPWCPSCSGLPSLGTEPRVRRGR